MAGKDKKGKEREKKIKVEFRSNIKEPRRKGDWYWTHKLKEDPSQIEDVDTVESVKGKGKLAKKRTVDADLVSPLVDLEGEAESEPTPEENWREGLVVSIHGQYIKVDDGKTLRTCVIRKLFKKFLIEQRNVIAVGDKVEFTPIGDSEGVIERIAPRYGMLFRYYQGKEHLIVANVDQVLIVSSVDKPPLRIHLVDRYIISALAGGLRPVIVFNKIDLSHDSDKLDEYEGVYRSLGYEVIRTSIITQVGLDRLKEVLKDRKTVLAGVSGVGKSSLINAVEPSLNLRTSPVSRSTGRGVHTTTVVQLLKLSFGGYIVDTPGIRQFALSKVPRDELDRYFDDFIPFLGMCKFSDCVHIEEADCAIKQAVAEGKIAHWRYNSYVKLYMDYEEFLQPWER